MGGKRRGESTVGLLQPKMGATKQNSDRLCLKACLGSGLSASRSRFEAQHHQPDHLGGQRWVGRLPSALQRRARAWQQPLGKEEVAGQQGDEEIDIPLATFTDTFLAPAHNTANPLLQIPLKMIQPQGRTITV